MAEGRMISVARMGPEQGERPSNVGYLTCYYWAMNGRCKHPDHVCKYAHYNTGTLAEQPIRLRPGEPAVAGTHLRLLAPYAPLTAVVANRHHPAFSGGSSNGRANASSNGILACQFHSARQLRVPGYGLHDEWQPDAGIQKGFLPPTQARAGMGGNIDVRAGGHERQRTESELVAAVTTELLIQEEAGTWDHGRAKALEAAETCARIWKSKYGGFGNL